MYHSEFQKNIEAHVSMIECAASIAASAGFATNRDQMIERADYAVFHEFRPNGINFDLMVEGWHGQPDYHIDYYLVEWSVLDYYWEGGKYRLPNDEVLKEKREAAILPQEKLLKEAKEEAARSARKKQFEALKVEFS
jgi:hypothetical protein